MRIFVASLLMIAATAPALSESKSYDIGQPKGTWQTPGPIQQPKGTWQQPGEIQIPKGIDAVRTTATRCERRLSVVADALFDFDKSNLRPEAEETLAAAGPEIAKLGGKPARIEGHTDAIGSDAYNMKLSEARAASVRVAGNARHRPAGNGNQRFRQDQSRRSQYDQRRARRSGRPTEESARRGCIQYLLVIGRWRRNRAQASPVSSA
jgi:hypothetical protein